MLASQSEDKSWTTLYFYYPLLCQLSSVDKSLGYSRSTMPPNLIQTFRPENIPATISAFRPDGEVPVLNEQYMDGGECRIFKADFSDGESWSVRIPIHVQSDSQDAIINVLRGEQDVLQGDWRDGLSLGPKTPWIQLHIRKLGWIPVHSVVVD